MRQTVEDPRVLWYRILLRKLLTARHYGEPLSAESPVEASLLLVKTCYARASCNQRSRLVGTEFRESIGVANFRRRVIRLRYTNVEGSSFFRFCGG